MQHIPATVSQQASLMTPKTPASLKKTQTPDTDLNNKRKRRDSDINDLPTNKKQAKVNYPVFAVSVLSQ